MADYAGRRWLQATGLDALERDVEPGLFRITAVDGGRGKDVAFLVINSPEPRPIANQAARGECSSIHGLSRCCMRTLLRHHGSAPSPAPPSQNRAGRRVACLSRALPLARGEPRGARASISIVAQRAKPRKCLCRRVVARHLLDPRWPEPNSGIFSMNAALIRPPEAVMWVGIVARSLVPIALGPSAGHPLACLCAGPIGLLHRGRPRNVSDCV